MVAHLGLTKMQLDFFDSLVRRSSFPHESLPFQSTPIHCLFLSSPWHEVRVAGRWS